MMEGDEENYYKIIIFNRFFGAILSIKRNLKFYNFQSRRVIMENRKWVDLIRVPRRF